MKEPEIIDVMLQACMAVLRMPDNARPATLRAINIGYIHTKDDINGQEPEPRRRLNTRNEIRLIDAAEDLVKLERRASYRRCLWAWAMSKAGRHQFKAWCKVEGIHVETGRRRAKDAVKAIASRFKCNDALHSENNTIEVLIAPPKTGYNDSKMPKSWMSDDARLARECAAYEWQGIREARNARRRMAAR